MQTPPLVKRALEEGKREKGLVAGDQGRDLGEGLAGQGDAVILAPRFHLLLALAREAVLGGLTQMCAGFQGVKPVGDGLAGGGNVPARAPRLEGLVEALRQFCIGRL